ncbi:MAG: hypothetical protein DHS20C17_14730 [Cyclobacteriaceae bacterium]|nr:MAG: hypothetical protein DHS20C17_14730 [Cyclobacteriaceae bacterium]
MGDLNVIPVLKSTDLRQYTQQLFHDVEALEAMTSRGMIEEGVHRMGAEQELCLIDKHGGPVPVAEKMLSEIDDPHFTTELARFNLEINLDPLELYGDCFAKLEKDLGQLLRRCQQAGELHYCTPLLTGILPTLRSKDLDLKSMTNRQRYGALNQAILAMRKSAQQFHIQGTDELYTSSDSVMFESCNTSFQIHYQAGAIDFASYYNWAQTIAGPVLAACTNAPLFLGKRLWSETRIALFQQATDTRGYHDELRHTKPRVFFGDQWMNGDVTDFIKKDLSTYRPLVYVEGIPNSMEQLSNGIVPELKAFSLFNGTIYRWNRPCYGITHGIPHLRIENRYLPSGPTVVDEVANTVFWVGLMSGLPESYLQMKKEMDFHDVKSNFIKAARHGLETSFAWMGGKYDAKDLILEELMPIARQGLSGLKIDQPDVQKYLEIIENRVDQLKTGSIWITNSYNALIKKYPVNTALSAITLGILNRQQQHLPVHQWTELTEEVNDGPYNYSRVEQIMSKELYTVFEEDHIDLVPNIMKWNQVRHMLVENRAGELVGLVTLGRLGKYYSEVKDAEPVMVKQVMINRVITVHPETSTLDAINLMQEKRIGCLPVLNHHHKLVGVLTEKDLLPVAASYLRIEKDQ